MPVSIASFAITNSEFRGNGKAWWHDPACGTLQLSSGENFNCTDQFGGNAHYQLEMRRLPTRRGHLARKRTETDNKENETDSNENEDAGETNSREGPQG